MRYQSKTLFVALLLATLAILDCKQGLAQITQQDVAPEQLNKSTWPAGVAARAELPTAGKVDYEFARVEVSDIEGWLKWFGVELPVNASGEISGWIWAQRGAGGWLSLRDYRVESEITSPKLQLDRWSIASARLRFGYQQGVWYIGNLEGKVAAIAGDEAASELGAVNFAARIPLAGERVATTEMLIENVNLDNLMRAFDIDIAVQNRGGQVELIAAWPLDSLDDLQTWNARATMQLSGLTTAGMQPLDLTSQLSLVRGDWTMTEGQASWRNQQPLELQGTGRLNPPYAFELQTSGAQLLLSTLLANLGRADVDLPITGRADLRGKVAGDAALGLDTATLELRSPTLNYRGLPLNNVDLQFNYRTAELQLIIRSLRVTRGLLAGDIRWASIEQITQGFPRTVRLQLRDLPLETLQAELTRTRLIPQPLAVGLQGIASGVLTLATETDEDKTFWKSDGALNFVNLSLSKTAIGETVVNWSKDAASENLIFNANTTDASLNTRINVVLGDTVGAALRHTDLVGYSAVGHLQDFAAEITASTNSFGNNGQHVLPLRASGEFELQGTELQGANANWLESGSAVLTSASIAMSDQVFELEQAVLSISPDEFRLQRFQVFDQRGRIAGSGIWRRQSTGSHQINLRVADVDLSPLAAAALPNELASLSGLANIEVRLTKAAAQADMLAAWTGTIAGDVADLQFKGTRLGAFALEGRIEEEQLSFELEGDLFRGEARASGTLPMQGLSISALSELTLPTDQRTLNIQSLRFDASLRNMDVRYLASMQMDQRQATQYSGLLSLEIQGHGTDENELELSAAVSSPALKHGRVELARDFLARVSYSDQTLEVTEIVGKVAEGRVIARGSVRLNTSNAQQRTGGELFFHAQRMQINGIVRLLNPDYADYYAGMLDYRGKLRVDGAVVLDGHASITNGIAYDVPVQDTRGSLRIEFTKAGVFEVLAARDLHGVAIGGDFAGDILLRGGSSYQLQAFGRVSDGKLDQLSKSLGFERIVGTGRFDGRIDLNSRNVTSLDALTGQVQINFENGDAQSVPVLSDLGRYVPVLQLASTDINSGTLHARIGNGVLRIQDFLLTGDSFWMAGEGNASLLRSQLDINAVLQTGGGLQQQLAQTVVQQLIVDAVPSVALVTRLNDVIRNRSLYFHIGGTTHRPAIQARAGLTLGKLVLQNVLRSITVTPLSMNNGSEAP